MPAIDAPAVIEQAKAAIDAIYRCRDLTPLAKLDALEKIMRHAQARDSKVRANIRAMRRKEEKTR